MATTQRLILSDGTLYGTVNENTVISPNDPILGHGITYTGRGVTEYGDHRNENILHIAERFASPDAGGGAPSSAIIPVPLVGQFWYDTTASILKVWTGTSWDPAAADITAISGTYSVTDPAGTINVPRSENGTPLPSPANDLVIINAAPASLLSAHIADVTGAHTAEAISFVAVGSIGANNTQDAVEVVQGNLTAHLNDTFDAHDASAISVVPVGSISSTTGQLAIQELVDERSGLDANIVTYNTNTNNHINDTVDAHDASAISFVPGVTGLVATNVQDAIDEVVATAGSAGSLETLRAYPSSTQTINTTATKILFQTLDYGNVSGQWNVATSDYTAAFDQEVNVKFAATLTVPNDRTAEMQIRKAGSVYKKHIMSKFDNDSGQSEVSARFGYETSTKMRLTAGQVVNFYMLAGSTTATLDPNIGTHVEFEIVKIL